MMIFVRLATAAVALAVALPAWGTPNLAVVRSGVGITGHPHALSATLDINGNGRPEMLVAGRFHVSIVEEDPNPRGYREVVRADAPALAYFVDAEVVAVPDAEPALLLHWSNGIEIRRAGDLAITAARPGNWGAVAVGDVDGDGQWEIVSAAAGTIKLLDPATLAERGSIPLAVGGVVLADIVGDGRPEIVTTAGSSLRAYTVTRSGDAWTANEVWNPGLDGYWEVHPLLFEGHSALLLYDGVDVRLATFGTVPAVRTVDSPEFAVTPVLADANGDGQVDLITSDGRILRAIDLGTSAVHWQRDTLFQEPRLGPVYFPIAIDMDGNGTSELAWADHSYQSGLVAVSIPPTGMPRWRSDFGQSHVSGWAPVARGDGSASIALLTHPARELPSLAAVGFLGGATLGDEGGSAFAWLPGYDGFSRRVGQSAIASFPFAGHPDAVVVAGTEYSGSGVPIAGWVWTFAGSGALLSERSLQSSMVPERIAVAQVLDRPERQLVVAGWMPPAGSGPATQEARVELVDHASGAVLWQSVPLPSYAGAAISRLEVADLDADGQLEIVIACGAGVSVLKPSGGTGAVASFTARDFSLLDRGPGSHFLLAILDDDEVAFHDGFSTPPVKQLVLPEAAYTLAAFTQAPDGDVMFVTGNHASGLVVRRYADGGIVASDSRYPGSTLGAMDIDGDGDVEIIGAGDESLVWRLRNEHLFRDGFDGQSPDASAAD